MLTRLVQFAIIYTAAALLACACAISFAADTVKPTGDNVIVNLEARNVSVQAAIERIFKGTGLSYQIDPGIQGLVIELHLNGVTLNQAIKAIADEVGLDVTVQDGIYVISVPTQVIMGRGPGASPVEELAPISEVVPEAEQSTAGQSEPTAADQSAPPAAAETTGSSGPVYYGEPGPVTYPFGYSGLPPAYQYGLVTILGGYTPFVLAPAHPGALATTVSPYPNPLITPSYVIPSMAFPLPIIGPLGW